MYINIFIKSKDNDRITTVLACLDKNSRVFSKKRWILKTVKTANITSNSLLYLRKYFINQNKNDQKGLNQKRIDVFVIKICNF